MTDAKAAICARLIVQWFAGHARALPWRTDYDPYKILVSEFMLQQTQAATVIPYFERWIARWPDLVSLAAAAEADVLKLWEGLGYYSRCRNLLRAARSLTEAGYKTPPPSIPALRACPGIGEYTAGAIVSIGYDQPAPAIDGNAERVLSRLFGISEAAQSAALRREAGDIAARMLSGAISPRAFNQAIMDLGATICAPRGTDCAACPVSGHCLAHREKKETAFPLPRPREPVIRDSAWGLVIFSPDKNQILIHRRPDRGLWASMWEIPWFPRTGAGSFQADFKKWRDSVRLNLNLRKGAFLEIGTVNFSFTRHRVKAQVVTCECETDKNENKNKDENKGGEWRFAAVQELGTLTLPAPCRKFLAAANMI